MARYLLLTLALIVSLPAAARAPRRKVVHHKPAAHTRLDAAAVNDPNTRASVGPRSSGAAVLRAQILLDRAHFSVGEMDGSYGDNMANTVKAFQTARGLTSDGIVHADTWTALDADTAPALVPFTIGDTDVAGPFVQVPADMLEQAKLPALGYQTLLEALSERFHSSPKLLEKLNPGKKFDQAGEQITVPNVERAPLGAKAAKVVVRADCNCLEAIDDQGKPMSHYPATMGSEHDPLPIGDWKIAKPVKNPIFFYNSALFWDATEAHAKARIKPGPNNPVGVVWIPLSKEHYGIHGTAEPSSIGKSQSHGCIRLTNWDAAELADLVTPGATAELRKE